MLFVRIGIAFYVIGLVLRDQVWLRISVLVGTLFYIAYYLTGAETPQWDAAVGSLLLLAANVYGLGALLLSRMSFTLSEDERAAMAALGPVEPGQLRRLMRLGELKTADGVVTLTEQGARPDRMWWVIDGAPVVEKDGVAFTVGAGAFVGEVTWLLGGVASATVTLPPGARYVEWRRETLDRRLRRRPRMAEALHAMIGMDMARKVAASRGGGAAPQR